MDEKMEYVRVGSAVQAGLMTVEELAAMMELRPFTIRSWVRAKQHDIPAIILGRVIRFDRTAISAWLKRFRR